MERDSELEKLMKTLGDWGRYQRFQFFLQVLSALPAGVIMISFVTIAGVPEHRCAIDGVDTSNYTEPWNSTVVTENIPIDEFGKRDSCHIYAINETVQECHKWVYDTTYFTSSRAIEWDFVCSRRWMDATCQSAFMFGVVLGSAGLGPLCDTFGRRSVYLYIAVLQLIVGIFIAFINEYYTFIAARFIYGIFALSPFKAGYVLMIELIGQQKRPLCGAIFQILFGIGIMLLGVWGYIIDNRFYLQIVYALHSTLMIPQWFLMDESPRWLWAKGRIGEAIAIVRKGIRINKTEAKLEGYLIDKKNNQPIEHRSGSILDLFRTPNMAKRSVILIGCWFAVSVVYYGLTLNSGKLNGNPFLILFLMGFVELPGYSLGMYLLKFFGHRVILSSSFLLCGLSCIIVVGLPFASLSTTVCTMIGKFISCASYAIVFKYSAELFPTVIRSTGLGFCTMCAGFSAAFTPLIALLDTFRPEIPTVVFGVSALVFGLCCLLLPETKGRNLPQTLEDGELFGIGESCFSDCRTRRTSDTSDCPEVEPLKSEEMNRKASI